MLKHEEWINEAWEKIDKKLSKTAVKSFKKIPYTTINGVHDNKMETDKSYWTNGFWPALMMLMYMGTNKEQYLKTARNAMDMLDAALYTYEGLHHDVGFMWNISSGTDYRFTGDAIERNRFLVAANHLMGRYNCEADFICAWNGAENKGVAIIDCMMNIPLLFRASEETGDERFAMAACRHANKTMKYHVRADGSCRHINEYDPLTGNLVKERGGQGYKEGSAWSRGQAWGLYGFALAYKHTKNTAYLDTAKKIAHYFIANIMRTDYLTLCDFRQPAEPVIYDSTAGVCAACGLLEIAQNAEDTEKDLYRDAAIRLLKAEYENWCDWSKTEDSILQMGTESYNNGIHIPIIYGDYFFAEGIYRLKGFDTSILW